VARGKRTPAVAGRTAKATSGTTSPSDAAALEETRGLTVVGIGASAGGLEAFTRLIGHLPPDTGLAFVLVQHLDPAHQSLLAELLARAASVPVVEAKDGMRVERDCVYVIPPNTTMTLTDGHLRLVRRSRTEGVHLPIDAFFRSLADVHGSGAVGVVLSGAGSDGSRGIEAIKAEGGITIAQDPASARYGSMPQNAIATGYVDFVLTPEGIAGRLTELGRHVAQMPPARDPGAEPSAGELEELNQILEALKARTKVDFRQYRRGTIQRRILRRMLLHRQDTHRDYLAHLRENPDELDALYEDLLIGVTSFFRDPDAFDALQRDAFAGMMAGHAPDKPIRVWIAGCSGGEEAYSVAIALIEFLGDAASTTTIQIFATDLSESSIARARAGRYPDGIAAAVSPERLERFFVREDSGYRIIKAVRDLCVFSRQDIVRDPPFSHLDLITCRNVLIYLEPALQQRVFPIFHYALESNGLLLLGSAESVTAASALFSVVDKRHRIFRPRPNAPRTLALELSAPTPRAVHRRPGRFAPATPPPANEIQSEADRVVLARYAPGGVVVNDNLEILQFRGRTAAFLEHPSGLASLKLLELVLPELVTPLRLAIQTARGVDQRVTTEGIVIGTGASGRVASLEVLPFRVPSSGERHFVITIQDAPLAAPPVAADVETIRRAPGSRRQMGQIKSLRDELTALKSYVQSVIEESETASEELRTANEEVQSSNEEFQSANEELETTKEEIQSTNEELETVNEELRHRNRELSDLSSDLANVLAGIDIPIIIVGSNLRLRRFTPATNRVMRIIPTDIGRPLEDVKLRFDIADFTARITLTIETLAVTETEVRDDEGHWWSLTIRPYQTVDRKVDGAVLVFSDVHVSKQYRGQIEEVSESRRQLLVTSEIARADADAAMKSAEIANRTKSGFLANMSHDLRTPLNAITGYAELMELGIRGPVTEMQRIDLARIKRSTRHLLSLINDILNFAKVEQGHLEFRMVDVPLDTVILELEEMIAPQFHGRLILLECAGCTGIVRADPERLRQIPLNLLTNALKFTAAGGRVTVTTEQAGEHVTIHVTDTGIGIRDEVLESIFEPFVQVDRSLTMSNTDGVGLGLSISRDLARRMDAELTVRSIFGEGSRFSLTLPRGAEVPEPA
jgi:two-component system, chemotaxis family, CheB/CheR fusion protein